MKTALLVLLTFISIPAMADKEITCYGPRNSHKIVLTAKSVSVSKPFSNISRNVASEISVRTRVMGNGFSKFFYLSGKKYTIHIDDRSNFSDIDDYMIIKSNNGHEITYPLNCQ